MFNMVDITNLGKGMVPTSLRGGFTNYNFAKQAVDTYLDVKEAKDGKTGSGG
jgi:hypothetical protein